MEKTNIYFQEALIASLNNHKVNWSNSIAIDEWNKLFYMAGIHHITPMIYEAVYDCPAFKENEISYDKKLKTEVIRSITLQAMSTDAFQGLFNYLRDNGIDVCVVKGLICRNMYPNPDSRMSSDEDIFITDDQFECCHNLMLKYGMKIANPDLDMEKEYEVPYYMQGSPLYIELHRKLFPPESEAYGNLNRFFDDIYKKDKDLHEGECGLIEEVINNSLFTTMNHTDHMLYLILHSFKHFLHSGFGIRQVCDINLFAINYGYDIDWDYVYQCCCDVRADLFAASVFKIGSNYLKLDMNRALFSEEWNKCEIDENEMLQDLLEAGVYGQADMNRKHSSNITLNAIIADRRGKSGSSCKTRNILQSVFLPREQLSARFGYLNKKPYLLPVAWIQRVWIYCKDTKGTMNKDVMNSLNIGNERVQLLKYYGIIK